MKIKVKPNILINLRNIQLIIWILFLAVACKHKDKQSNVEVITMNDTRPINDLKELVLKKGDTVAYDELHIAYLNEEHSQEYLLYSIVMANKYNHPQANCRVYYCLTDIFKDNDLEIDKETMALAIKYLKRGAEQNDGESLKRLGELYLDGKYLPKDTILGKKLYENGRKLVGF